MIRIDIESETHGIQNLVDSKKLSTVISRTNKAVSRNIGNRAKTAIRESFTINDLSNNRGDISSKATDSSITIISKGNNISLSHFKHSPRSPMEGKTSGGVTVEVLKGKPRHYAHAFVANLANKSVFQRITSKRTPLRRLNGASIPEMLSYSPVTNRIINSVLLKFDEELARNLQ